MASFKLGLLHYELVQALVFSPPLFHHNEIFFVFLVFVIFLAIILCSIFWKNSQIRELYCQPEYKPYVLPIFLKYRYGIKGLWQPLKKLTKACWNLLVVTGQKSIGHYHKETEFYEVVTLVKRAVYYYLGSVWHCFHPKVWWN